MAGERRRVELHSMAPRQEERETNSGTFGSPELRRFLVILNLRIILQHSGNARVVMLVRHTGVLQQ